MARQLLSDKNVNKYRKKYGLDIVGVLVRGGTDHRKDLLIKDGTIVHLFKDGTIEKAEYGWSD